MKVYEVVSPLVENDIHNPSFTYRNVVELVSQIRAADPNEQGSRSLDAAFNSNDTILFLGAVGAAEISGTMSNMRSSDDTNMDLDFGMPGGDADTQVPDLAPDTAGLTGPQAGGRQGYFEPWSGGVRLEAQTWLQLMMGRPNTSSANTVIHELMHRGFAILWRVAREDPALQAMLPNDLTTVWQGGWGNIDYDRYADGRDPEHAMIYAMTTTPGNQYDQAYVQDTLQSPWAQAFFTPQWQASFDDNYEDMTRDRPTSDSRRVRTYWQILYYNTERALSGYLRQNLRMPPNQTASPRPQARPETESQNRTRKKS